MAAILIGIVAGFVCLWAVVWLKAKLGYDDSLDVFGVHGVGGILGTLLCGVFAAAAVTMGPDTPKGLPGLLEGNPQQLLTQLYGVVATVVWCGAATWVVLKVVDLLAPLRVSKEHEIAGLDISLHGESLQ
jgi:Amt family ammonium transporter